ncbi:MAG: hypothetical protein ABIR70_00775 [Bryobacteraceae bacterium]
MTKLTRKFAFGLAGLLCASGIVMSQQKPNGPRLYRMWSDTKGDTHVEEINIATKGRLVIPGIVMNFSGNTPGAGSEQLHNTRVRQFAVTVFGELDVEASDGSKAHLRTGDMSFVEDVQGKGHKTFEKGAQSVFLQVPEGFDVKKWAAGQ